MALVLPNCGERYLLDRALKGLYVGNNLTLKLYTAVAGGLSKTTVLGDVTEATFPGYSATTLAPSSWNAAATNAGVSASTYADQVFTRTTAGTNEAVLGYYVVDLATSILVWAEAFAATANMVNANDSITVTPRFQQA